MKIIQINWETGKVLEKGVLSTHHTFEEWVQVYKKINAQLASEDINKVWLIAP